MNKNNALIFGAFIAIALLSVSLASASLLGDFWNKITGNAVAEQGYRYAKWTCVNGVAYSEGSSTSCKTTEEWKTIASEKCINICVKSIWGAKRCGVATFSAGGELCNKMPPATCTDSDEADIYTKGTVDKGTANSTRSDYCTGLGSNMVVEYTCQGSVYNLTKYDCKYGCKDGACVKEEIIVLPNETITPTPSEVTYQGILNMLKKCKLIGTSGADCITTCENQGRVCASATAIIIPRSGNASYTSVLTFPMECGGTIGGRSIEIFAAQAYGAASNVADIDAYCNCCAF